MKHEAHQHSPAERRSFATFWFCSLLVCAVLASCAWLLFAEHNIAGQWGFSLDDSWIYATFARNIATGGGYSFNAGERIAGATGPLYALILALFYRLVGLVSPLKPFPENLKYYRPKYLAIFPGWFKQYAAANPRTRNSEFYDADSIYKYAPVAGAGLRFNTICSRDKMFIYARLSRGEEGPEHVKVVWH